MTRQELNNIKKTTLIELELKMNKEIQSKKTEIYARINKSVKESRNIYPESNDTKLAYKKCPACKTKLNGNEMDWYECGLRLQ